MLATAAQTTTENMGLGGPPGKARGGPQEGWFPDQGRVVPRPGTGGSQTRDGWFPDQGRVVPRPGTSGSQTRDGWFPDQGTSSGYRA